MHNGWWYSGVLCHQHQRKVRPASGAATSAAVKGLWKSYPAGASGPGTSIKKIKNKKKMNSIETLILSVITRLIMDRAALGP